MNTYFKNSARILFLISGVFLFACNTMPSQKNQNWQALVDRMLPGTWTSDKFGRLYISCDGYIHLDDQGGFDLSNTGLKNAKIIEMQPKDLLVETLPFVKEHYAMAEYPHAEAGETVMKFWGRVWKRAEVRECPSSP